MPEKVKDITYSGILLLYKIAWKIFKPTATSARILLVTDTHILLVQHRKSLSWNLPGGGKKRKETPEACAFRELCEETHIDLKDADFLLGTYQNKREGKQDTIYIFVKKIPEQMAPRKAFELKNAQWFPFSSLPKKISPATKARISEYLGSAENLEGVW
jgi:8-oxo-dGTP pyrophosphatase MutT (NUDIX family)